MKNEAPKLEGWRLFLWKVTIKANCLIPDKLYCRILFWIRIGKRLNLKHPKTFNEKLQWLKLYNRNPLYTSYVDKYEVKSHVKDIIGEDYIVKTLGVWDTPENIEWDKLPSKFVLKTTHGGGGCGVIICKDKSLLDKDLVIKQLNQSLQFDIYKRLREWPYKNVKKRIIAEELLENDESGEVRDYKFFCFNGEAKILLLVTERKVGDTALFDYYDKDFHHLPLTWTYPNSPHPETKVPRNLHQMFKIASDLSKGIPHVRVDLYNINGKIYFGEMTFFHACGLCPFAQSDWDIKMGEWITLPTSKMK